MMRFTSLSLNISPPKLALGVGEHRLDDVAAEVRGPAGGAGAISTPVSVHQMT